MIERKPPPAETDDLVLSVKSELCAVFANETMALRSARHLLWGIPPDQAARHVRTSLAVLRILRARRNPVGESGLYQACKTLGRIGHLLQERAPGTINQEDIDKLYEPTWAALDNPTTPLQASEVDRAHLTIFLERALPYLLESTSAWTRTPRQDIDQKIRLLLSGRPRDVPQGEIDDPIVHDDDFERLMRHVSKLRDAPQRPWARAILVVLREGGVRSHELRALKYGGVRRFPGKIVLQLPLDVALKTGPRPVAIVAGHEILLEWLRVHPDPRPDAPLFPNMSIQAKGSRPMALHDLPNFFHRWTDAAGCKRIVRPHRLRHTRTTELSIGGLSINAIQAAQGWSPKANTIMDYDHRTSDDDCQAYQVFVETGRIPPMGIGLPTRPCTCGTATFVWDDSCRTCGAEVHSPVLASST